jgi:hypothetical protein
MPRSNFIVVAVFDLPNQMHTIYIYDNKNLSVLHLEHPIKRLVTQDQKIFVIFEDGGFYQFDTERWGTPTKNVGLERQEKRIEDYCEIDSEVEVTLMEGNQLHCYWL